MLKKWYTYMLFVVATLCSCSSGCGMDVPDSENKDVTVMLTLSMPPTAQTRATYETTPFGNDYHIPASDVQVIVYNADGTFKDHAVVADVAPTATYYKYVLTCKLEKFKTADLSKEYKIVVLTNLNGNATTTFPTSRLDGTTEETLYPILETHVTDAATLASDIANMNDNGIIPMWGSKTAVITAENYETIYLMRALAKVEVHLSQELIDEGYTFAAANNRVAGAVNNGYLTPLNAHTAAHTEATYETGTEHSTLNVNNKNQPSNAAFYKHTDGVLYTYIPEQEANTTLSLSGLHINVAIENQTNGIAAEDYQIHFANYIAGKVDASQPFPVRRNHLYRYTVNSLGDTEFTFQYQVADWGTEEIQIPEFK